MFQCRNCSKKYTHQNKPLVLPSCGHTFCQSCLEKQLIDNKQNFQDSSFIICFEDKIIYQDLKDLSQFPINNQLLENIQTRPGQFCLEHNKAAEYYCLTDKTFICAICGLFGSHKNHKHATFTELNNINNKLVEQIQGKFDQMLYQGLYKEDLQKVVNEILLQINQEIETQTEKEYKTIKLKLKQRMDELKQTCQANISQQLDSLLQQNSQDFGFFVKKFNQIKNSYEKTLKESEFKNQTNISQIYSQLLQLNIQSDELKRQYQKFREGFEFLNKFKIIIKTDWAQLIESVQIEYQKNLQGLDNQSNILQESISKIYSSINSSLDQQSKQNKGNFLPSSKLEVIINNNCNIQLNDRYKKQENSFECSAQKVNQLLHKSKSIENLNHYQKYLIYNKQQIQQEYQGRQDINESRQMIIQRKQELIIPNSISKTLLQTQVNNLMNFPKDQRCSSISKLNLDFLKSQQKNVLINKNSNESCQKESFVSNQQIDKQLLREIIVQNSQSKGSHIHRLVFRNNNFNCDVLKNLKEIIKEKLQMMLIIDLKGNNSIAIGLDKLKELKKYFLGLNVKIIF